jgi:hypothetical protein
MEIDGHPTQDIVEELERRGAVSFKGNTLGPQLDLPEDSVTLVPGIWLFLPPKAYETEIDEPLNL